jgi:hypothetical protein
VLSEAGCLTAFQRKKTESWCFGTVGGMAHLGTLRADPGHSRTSFPLIKIILVGTPFRRDDLLMSMQMNSYAIYRYAAEYDPSQFLRPTESLAVEIA